MFGRLSFSWWPARLQVLPLLGATTLFVMLGSFGDFYNYRVHFGPYLADITPGELRLWLASVLLILPGCWLALQGLSGYWMPWALAAPRWLALAGRRQVVCATVFTGLGLLLIYRILRWLLLRDSALTDDETMIRFGGQIIASGHLSAPKLWPFGTVTELYTVTTDNRIFSMDWPGGLLFSAVSQVTRLGPWLYAMAAAGTFAAVVLTAVQLWGALAGAIAGVLWLVSPMAWTLSLTEHTHIVSRACVALSLLATAVITHPDEARTPKPVWGALLGAAAAYSLATRPYETASSLAPIGLYLTWVTFKDPKRYMRPALFAALAFVPLVFAYSTYNRIQTGSMFLTPRSVTWATDAQLPTLGLWHRMGQNLTHNWLMLGVWAGGLFGFPLAYLGLSYQDRPSRTLRRLLGAGAVAQLLTALGHENLGIHIVGPIHYSELAPHLTLLITAGVLELGRLCAVSPVAVHALSVVLGGHTVMLVVTGAMYAGSLFGIGRIATIVSDAVRDQGLHQALVAAPTPGQLHGMSPNLTGSWQLVHPPPDPFLKDDVIYTYLEVPRDTLLTAFPDRKLYVATYNGITMQVTFELVTQESLALQAKAAAPVPAPKPAPRRRRRARPAAAATTAGTSTQAPVSTETRPRRAASTASVTGPKSRSASSAASTSPPGVRLAPPTATTTSDSKPR